MILRLFIFTLFLAMTTTIFSQPPPIESGVSQQLAIWRAKHYSDVRYYLNLTLEKMSPLMKGEIAIRVTMDEEAARNPLILDWRTTAFENDEDKPSAMVTELNGKKGDIRWQIENEHIVVKDIFRVGENTIKLKFASPIKTSGSAITRYIDKEDGSEYIYSLFVPSDASTAFPVFDQPDLKASFLLNILVPKDWQIISNSSEEDFASSIPEEIIVDGRKQYKQTRTLRHFEFTKPISTYVFAFAAGNFTEIIGERPTKYNERFQENIPLAERGLPTARVAATNIYVRKSQAEKFKQHSAEVFRLNRECVKYLEEYFDYDFPFPKYDLVLIPEFPFGGMEHAGATFLRESSIIFPSEPTKSDLVNRANLIFHEAAHQWFGDTVTMKWFDDLWLKEGFATFMGYKAMEKIMPEFSAWKVFYERTKQTAYLTDSTKGTTPIYQEIPNLSAAKSAYGNIVYNKAPAFLRQAEFYLGEKEFQIAVRNFLKKNEFKNATWQDLVSEFEFAAKKDLKDWANVWVKQKGLPIVRSSVNLKKRSKPITYFDLKQKDIFGTSNVWKMRIKFIDRHFATDYIDSVLFETLTNPDYLYYRNIIPPSQFIFPNYQDYGYGIFLLDKGSLSYVLANVQNEKDEFLRSMMYGSLWDSVREAELNPKDYVELVVNNVAAEKDEMIVSAMLSRTNTAFTYYLDDKTRNELSPKLENVLFERMKNSETLGQRITFYRAFLNVANSLEARKALKDILKGERYVVAGTLQKITENIKGAAFVPSLPELKTKDKFDILAKLFILNDKDAEQLFVELVKTETSDDAKRYAYAARAGIANAENKAKYFNDFVEDKEISESWIEAAFIPFNSPKHSDLTLPYLEKALAELPKLKRNRKIFFVNGWLGAFIGGQKSEEALKIVNKFLADNPNLDKDLRLKILENVDIIERSVRIRSKSQKM